jgi:hypothetical protein
MVVLQGLSMKNMYHRSLVIGLSVICLYLSNELHGGICECKHTYVPIIPKDVIGKETFVFTETSGVLDAKVCSQLCSTQAKIAGSGPRYQSYTIEMSNFYRNNP